MDRATLVRTYMNTLKEHNEVENKVKAARLKVMDKRKLFNRSEDHIKAQQSVGQIIGEVLQMLTPEKFIVKTSMGP